VPNFVCFDPGMLKLQQMIKWDVFWGHSVVYILSLILFKELLNVTNEEKFTTHGGKLFQTFITRSLTCFSTCSCGSSEPVT